MGIPIIPSANLTARGGIAIKNVGHAHVADGELRSVSSAGA
jgi:hypothetical protein